MAAQHTITMHASSETAAGAPDAVTINGISLAVSPGETILAVAQRSGIYIPTLCARSDLPSTGSCRLCMVKVEGMRGYVTACSTPAEPGMIVTTNSPEIAGLRRRVLELILSEHPSACLVCSTLATCDKFNAPTAKAGRVTGCNMCPNRDACELRQLADYLGLKDIRYPLLYKGLALERDDPFMDRDYNLCILCGRCIRVCQDNLGLSAISFVRRGHATKVGTCFDRLHIDGTCVFCMHCVDVCPTGALTVRGSKWYGTPEKETPSTCILCERGCGLVVDTKWGKVMGAHPVRDMTSAGREYCVKGRCCLPPLVNSPDRLKYPAVRREDGRLMYAEWDGALEHLAGMLKRYHAAEIAVCLSPHLTDEAVCALSEFARVYADSNLFYTADGELMPAALDKSADILRGIRLLYLTEAGGLSTAALARCTGLEQIIIQDSYPSPLCGSPAVCGILPAAAFTETDGTKTCAGNRRQPLIKAAEPPGSALPDWDITVRLGRVLGSPDFRLKDLRSARAHALMHPWILAAVPRVPKDALYYRGIRIADRVPDFKVFVERRLKTQGAVHL